MEPESYWDCEAENLLLFLEKRMKGEDSQCSLDRKPDYETLLHPEILDESVDKIFEDCIKVCSLNSLFVFLLILQKCLQVEPGYRCTAYQLIQIFDEVN